jgi:membrane-associated protein
VTVLASSAGLPLPMAPILLVAGSVAAAEGLNVATLFLLVVTCSVAGDCLDYYVGRRLGHLFLQRIQKKRPSAVWSVSWVTIEQYFARWSGISIFLSRCVFTPFGSVVSILAGVGNYPFRRFLIFAVAGEIISAAIFLGLGYTFGANWPSIWDDVDGLPGILTFAALGLLLIFAGLKRLLATHHHGRGVGPGPKDARRPNRA